MGVSSRAELTELFQHPNLHEIGRRAQELRERRFGRQASFVAVEHLAAAELEWCSVCGAEDRVHSFRREVVELAPDSTDLHVLVPPGADGEALLRQLDAVPEREQPPRRTVQVGCASDWMRAGAGDDSGLLGAAIERGLRVVSEGVMPEIHPAHGAEFEPRWSRFWRAAERAGVKGHATVSYGPGHDVASLLDQIEALAGLQAETGVFHAVTAVVDPGDRFGGVQDSERSEGQEDLRVLAMCRLGLADIPHLSISYNRGDLKMAHVSLATGADDLQGHLALETRDPTAEANANDLSFREAPRWLREAGYTPLLRNGAFEITPFPEDRP